MYENAHCAYVNAHKNQCINTNIEIFFLTHNCSERRPESVTFLEILTDKSTDNPTNQPTEQPTDPPTNRKTGSLGSFTSNNQTTDRQTGSQWRNLHFHLLRKWIYSYSMWFFFLLFCRHLSYSFFLLLICMSVCLSNLFSWLFSCLSLCRI